MPDLGDTLTRLGLQQYQDVLSENGFTSWEVVLDITEDDFQELGFKLGHRRVLQREIASFRGIPLALSLDSDGTPATSPMPTAALDAFPFPAQAMVTPPPRTREGKRRYRRHPKADENAPKKPKTAYVNFADHLRTDSSIKNLSFVDIAKEVGRQWQVLAPEKKHAWECNAARAMQDYEAAMDEYRKTDKYAKYQQYLEDFRRKQAIAKERKEAAIRANESPGSVDAFSRLSSSSPVSTHSTTTPDLEKFTDSLNQALSELGLSRQDPMSPGSVHYDSSRLPPQDLVRSSAAIMLEGSGSFLFIWTPQQAQDIIDRMYNPTVKADSMTLAEGFAMAACGAQFNTKLTSETIRRALYAAATTHFAQDMASMESLRPMRILAALSFYALLEKNMSARQLTVAGLQIARGRTPQVTSAAGADSWRKVYRTLVFLDCWLASSLGYSSEVVVADISCAFSAAWNPTDVNDAIHHHTSSIALITSEILKGLNSSEDIAAGYLGVFSAKLDAWYRDLPPFMQLEALTSNRGHTLSYYQRRSIFMTHMMYLGAAVLLYRQLLAISSQPPVTASPKPHIEHYLKTYHGQCIAAAQQIARILRLLGHEGFVSNKDWVIIYWSYNACIALLSDVAERMRDNVLLGVEEDLAHIKVCLDVLKTSSEEDILAAKFVNILGPSYSALESIQHRHTVKSRTSIHALLHPSTETSRPASPASPPARNQSSPELATATERLSTLLKDPFGRRQDPADPTSRAITNADGSHTVFWWR